MLKTETVSSKAVFLNVNVIKDMIKQCIAKVVCLAMTIPNLDVCSILVPLIFWMMTVLV